mmetsp:Transcript_27981/g.66495  ORF Transcript_27981/g.66495 Transcript_27981/m.66495 type:complete len:222 (-) Transcript_27981:37-702(-)
MNTYAPLAGPHSASNTPTSPIARTLHTSGSLGTAAPAVGFITDVSGASRAVTITLKSAAAPWLQNLTVPTLRSAPRATRTHWGLGSRVASAVLAHEALSLSRRLETGRRRLYKVDCRAGLSVQVSFTKTPQDRARSHASNKRPRRATAVPAITHSCWRAACVRTRTNGSWEQSRTASTSRHPEPGPPVCSTTSSPVAQSSYVTGGNPSGRSSVASISISAP